MKKSNLMITLLVLILSVFSIYGQRMPDAVPGDDRTLSPYFFVQSDDPEIDAMPLLKTSADVKILGVIADVTVKQVYKNDGTKPLEAVYTFPASTRAAVYAMTMKIGDRVLKAEVQTREQARATYEKAKEEGKSTSLLEQQRPNVFQMNVANIMPGDIIEVEMKYTELLIPEDAVYEFVYPTVVGPRYSNTPAEAAGDDDRFVNTPYTGEGEESFYDFDIKVDMTAGMPIEEVFSPSHDVDIEFTDDQFKKAAISLESGEEKSGNKDFVLRYTLSGDKIQTGLLLSKGEKENFFLLMLQPPKKVREEDIPPREYIFVVDVSGSMNGFPLDITKDMMKKLLGNLKENDLFNVLLFAGSSKFLNCMSVPASKENIDEAIRVLTQERGGGGTELVPALTKVYNNPKASGYSRSIIILTDGYINVEEETFDLIAGNLNKANVFSFGIGSSVNRYLIEGMARVGDGQPFFVLDPRESDVTKDKFLKYISSPVMTDVEVEFNGFRAYDVEPRKIADVMSERPILIYGKYEGQPTGTIRVKGLVGGQELHVDIPVSVFAGDDPNQALKYIWARNRIAVLSDYNTVSNDSNRVKEVTELGLKYNLLTKYTSFVAVDYEVRNKGKEIVKVKQPLPLPEGVSDYAVGANATMQAKHFSGGMGKGKMSISSLTVGSSGTDNALAPMEDFTEMKEIEREPEGPTNTFKDNVVYPQKALDNGIDGHMRVWALTDRLGNVIFVELIETDSPMLYGAAVQGLRKSVLKPAERYGTPIYAWHKLEIEFNSAQGTADIVGEVEVVEIWTNPTFSDVAKGSGKVIKPGDTVRIRYTAFTDECLKIELDKEETFIYGRHPLNPALDLMVKNMAVGGIRKAVIPELFFNPEAKAEKYSTKMINFELELLEVM